LRKNPEALTENRSGWFDVSLCPFSDTGTPSVLLRCVHAWGKACMDRSEAYRHFAAQCLEMARTMKSQQDRAILLEMALLWSRLAEHVLQSTTRKTDADLV
jgi:hypothetical protein